MNTANIKHIAHKILILFMCYSINACGMHGLKKLGQQQGIRRFSSSNPAHSSNRDYSRLGLEKNYLEDLPAKAKTTIVKKAYKDTIKKFHPDIKGGSFTRKAQEINTAYSNILREIQETNDAESPSYNVTRDMFTPEEGYKIPYEFFNSFNHYSPYQPTYYSFWKNLIYKMASLGSKQKLFNLKLDNILLKFASKNPYEKIEAYLIVEHIIIALESSPATNLTLYLQQKPENYINTALIKPYEKLRQDFIIIYPDLNPLQQKNVAAFVEAMKQKLLHKSIYTVVTESTF